MCITTYVNYEVAFDLWNGVISCDLERLLTRVSRSRYIVEANISKR